MADRIVRNRPSVQLLMGECFCKDASIQYEFVNDESVNGKDRMRRMTAQGTLYTSINHYDRRRKSSCRGTFRAFAVSAFVPLSPPYQSL